MSAVSFFLRCTTSESTSNNFSIDENKRGTTRRYTSRRYQFAFAWCVGNFFPLYIRPRSLFHIEVVSNLTRSTYYSIILIYRMYYSAIFDFPRNRRSNLGDAGHLFSKIAASRPRTREMRCERRPFITFNLPRDPFIIFIFRATFHLHIYYLYHMLVAGHACRRVP